MTHMVRLTPCPASRYIPPMKSRQKTPAKFPNRLREVRNQRGLTQQALADKSGIERNYIQKLESGHVWLSPEKLRPLASALECGWWELMPDAPGLDAEDLRLVAALKKMGAEGREKLMDWLDVALAAQDRDQQQ